MAVGSVLGGFVPNLWGTSALSLAGFLWSGIGSLAGIWIGYKLANSY